MLELTTLDKRYGDVIALDGVSLAAPRGRLLGFLGPNGAGKTTTMRAIFGLVRLDSGTVSWDGRPVGRSERTRFGYMPEQRGLYPKMRLTDQLTFVARLHGLEREKAGANADRWLSRLGLDGRSHEPLENLSHGNQQRVQLAAALVHDPELVVLDEPFSGLDPIGVETMSRILRECASEGAAVLFSSHQLDLVEDLCDDVVVVNQGRVVLSGPVRQLRTASPIRVLEVETFDGTVPVALQGLSHEVEGNICRVVVDADRDLSQILTSLAAEGRITGLSYSSPTLSHLFREVVR